MSRVIFLIVFISFFYACGGGTTKPKQKDISTKPASSSLKALPVIDGLTSIVLNATGNTMTTMDYDIKNIVVKAGSKVNLKLVNAGSDKMMVHNFVLVQKGKADEVGVKAIKAGNSKKYVPDHPAVIVASDLAQPGQTVELEFEAPPVGDYTFICTYPGHHMKMRGRFRVID